MQFFCEVYELVGILVRKLVLASFGMSRKDASIARYILHRFMNATQALPLQTMTCMEIHCKFNVQCPQI